MKLISIGQGDKKLAYNHDEYCHLIKFLNSMIKTTKNERLVYIFEYLGVTLVGNQT